MFTIEIKRKALRNLRRLSEKEKNSIRDIVLNLKKDPVPFRLMDVSKLKGYENIYRIRLGGLRIVYEVLWDDRRILIHYVGPRERAYEQRY